MAKLIGNKPDQVPTNGDLGTLAFQDSDNVIVENLTVSGSSSKLVVEDNSTDAALRVTQTGSGNALVVEDSANPDSTPFVVDANGKVGIGTNPASALHVRNVTPKVIIEDQNNGTGGSSYNPFVEFQANGDNVGSIGFTTNGNNFDIKAENYNSAPIRLFTGGSEAMRIDSNQSVQIKNNTSSDALRITQTGSGNALVVEDSTNPDSTPFVVDSNGNILVGLTEPRTTIGLDSGLQLASVNTTSKSAFSQSVYRNDASGTIHIFAKSRGTTENTFTAVQSSDNLGSIFFVGADGSAFVRGASIKAQVDGTPSTNDMPGRLVFSTTADGASSPTERMRIDSNGAIGLSGANYGTSGQVLTSGGSGAAPTWADVSGGAWSLVSEVTVSSTVSSVDLEGMDSTYKNYCVIISDGTLDSGENIYLRFKNGGSYDTSSIYSNIEAGMRSSNNIWNIYQKENLSAMEWMNMTSAQTGHQGMFYIFNPSHTTSRTSIIGHWTVGDGNGSYYSTYTGLYNKTSSAAVTGIRLYPNNRNWTGGNFRLYGIGG